MDLCALFVPGRFSCMPNYLRAAALRAAHGPAYVQRYIVPGGEWSRVGVGSEEGGGKELDHSLSVYPCTPWYSSMARC